VKKGRSKRKKPRILVALSGGVDSSTAAVLLKETGYDIEGAIMVFEGVKQENIELAASVARKISIPFHRVDIEKEFRELIISYFSDEYASGRTPNPCVRCNQLLKFDLLLNKGIPIAFDKIATGHYARVEEKDGRFLLKRGKDKNEQSYFLYRLSQEQLSKTILPLGELTKEEVRKRARKYDLPTAKRKKSQDACFIPDGDYASFLKKILPEKAGPVVNEQGETVGKHKGIFHYTVGQRHGLGISHKHPYYVTKIDAKNNTIHVGERKEVFKRQLIASDLNLIPFDNHEGRLEVTDKVRYLSPLSKAIVEPMDEKVVRVMFENPQWAITPGQSIVFYQDDLVIGGGVIEKSLG
jgi:tRNA-specific 2-thiouridylase